MLTGHRQAVQAAFEHALGPSARLAVTGATGWLGAALAQMAVRSGLGADNGRLRLFASKAGTLALEDGRTEPLEPLSGAPALAGEGWTVAHFAGLGKERTAGLSAQDYVVQSLGILEVVKKLAADATEPRIIFASSGAVYGPGGLPPALEAEPYGHVKGLHEAALADWCAARANPLTVCRIFNVGGPYGNKLNLYALSSLIQAALAEGPIPIRAKGPVLRSYVHVEELMAALVSHVKAARAGVVEPFDTAGTTVVEIGELAQRVCARTGADPTRIVRDYDPALPASRYVGDAGIYQAVVKRLGLNPIGLDGIVDDTAHSLAAPGPGGPAAPHA